MNLPRALMRPTSDNDDNFLGYTESGTKLFLKILNLNINRYYQGNQRQFCFDFHEKIEAEFRRIYKRQSQKDGSGKLWLPTTTLSRWMQANSVKIESRYLAYLERSGMVRHPKSGIALKEGDFLEILRGFREKEEFLDF